MADFDPDAFVAKAKAAQPFDPDAFLAKAGVQPTPPADAGPRTTGLEAFAGHAADNVPFMRQLAAAVEAGRMKMAGSPMDFGENYKQLLLAQQRQLDASKAEHGVFSRAGSTLGFLGTAAALPGSGFKSLAALGGALGLSDATTNPDATPGSVAGQTLASLALTPLLGKAASTVAPYLGEVAGRSAEALGEKARNLAGWLKVNSIHPTPTLGEAMEDIPGGVPAVGRELLARGIGGLTKSGTAKQIEAAFSGATGKASALAQAFDEAGGGSVNLGPALEAAQAKAEQLTEEPSTREAGQKLQGLIEDYAEKYGAGESAPASAVEALASKRGLGAIGYGAKTEFKLTKNPVSGEYGKAVRGLERGMDSALDDSLGPDFEAANLAVRRLGGAKQAAERAAARTTGDKLLGLLPYLAGLSGYAGGHAAGQATPEAVALGLGSLLTGKYGAQAGAWSLYNPVGGTLSLLGRGLRTPLAASMASTAAGEGATPAAGTLGELLSSFTQPRPATVADRERQRQQAILQALAQGSP